MASHFNKGNKGASFGKLNTSNLNNPINISRKEFLEDLPNKTRNTVRGVDLTLINKAITAIMEGGATINGKAPDTRFERFIIIASYFKALRTPLNMFFDDILNVDHNYTVAFNYEDKPYTIELPENLIKN